MARVIRGSARVVRAGARERGERAILAGLAEIARERARLRESAARDVGTLALEVATRIVAERIETDPALLDRIVLRALTRARADAAVQLVLHPADRALVEARLGERLPPEIALVDDPTQLRGGCLVRGTLVTVDARVETAIAAIAHAMAVEGPT